MKHYKRGWFGDSHGHALAAKGVRLYAKKTPKRDMFYQYMQRKRVPVDAMRTMIRKGVPYEEMKRAYPDVDAEELRLSAIREYDGTRGSNTLQLMNDVRVDTLEEMAKNPRMKQAMMDVLNNRQGESLLRGKSMMIRAQLEGMR